MRSEGMTWRMRSACAVGRAGSVKEVLPQATGELVAVPVAHQDTIELEALRGALSDGTAEVGTGVVEAGLADEMDGVGRVVGVVAKGIREGAHGAADELFEGTLAPANLV